jgi:hypothetical protein
MKVKKPESSRKMTMKTNATGEAKYPLSSRFAMVRIGDQWRAAGIWK